MQVRSQTEIADAVDDAEIDGFRAGTHLWRDFVERHAVDLRRRSGVNVLPKREGFAHRFVAGKMGEQTQFDLRVIRIDEYAACRGDERAADFAPHRRAHGDILQIRLTGRNAPRRGDGLIEPRVNAAVAARQPEQTVDIGALELGNLTIEQNLIHGRVKLGQLV